MEQLLAADGRTLDVLRAGAASGPALVCHHGTPGDASLWSNWDAIAAEHALQLISITRPGYATSTRLPGRNVASIAADVQAILDRVHAPWFLTAGWSGGGPHAVACAALLPDTCRGAATLAGVAPFDAPDLDFLAAMGPENHEEFGAALAGEATLAAWLERHCTGLRTIAGEDVAPALGGLINAVDRASLTGSFADHMAAGLRRSVATSFAGWIDDDLAFTKPWGFAFAGMRMPVTVWQGDNDLMVPFAHGAWLAATIPGARAQFRPGHGHISLVADLGEEIVLDLLTYARK